MRKIILAISLLLAAFWQTNSFATPREIIIVRHGDKLEQPATGPTLSAKGQIRALNFAFYFLSKFGEPDAIFATLPEQGVGKDSSIRELQTVAPLANMLAEKHSETGFPIQHPYASSNYADLAHFVLTNSVFNNKFILICWNHKLIPQLAKALGVQQTIQKWPKSDFDSVYDLKFNPNGQINSFTILNAQYPVKQNPSWQQLHVALSAIAVS